MLNEMNTNNLLHLLPTIDNRIYSVPVQASCAASAVFHENQFLLAFKQ